MATKYIEPNSSMTTNAKAYCEGIVTWIMFVSAMSLQGVCKRGSGLITFSLSSMKCEVFLRKTVELFPVAFLTI